MNYFAKVVLLLFFLVALAEVNGVAPTEANGDGQISNGEPSNPARGLSLRGLHGNGNGNLSGGKKSFNSSGGRGLVKASPDLICEDIKKIMNATMGNLIAAGEAFDLAARAYTHIELVNFTSAATLADKAKAAADKNVADYREAFTSYTTAVAADNATAAAEALDVANAAALSFETTLLAGDEDPLALFEAAEEAYTNATIRPYGVKVAESLDLANAAALVFAYTLLTSDDDAAFATTLLTNFSDEEHAHSYALYARRAADNAASFCLSARSNNIYAYRSDNYDPAAYISSAMYYHAAGDATAAAGKASAAAIANRNALIDANSTLAANMHVDDVAAAAAYKATTLVFANAASGVANVATNVFDIAAAIFEDTLSASETVNSPYNAVTGIDRTYNFAAAMYAAAAVYKATTLVVANAAAAVTLDPASSGVIAAFQATVRTYAAAGKVAASAGKASEDLAGDTIGREAAAAGTLAAAYDEDGNTLNDFRKIVKNCS